MNVRDVRELTAQGRVIKAPHYHPGKRGLSFAQILVALERCYHVAPDERTASGSRKHPRGWYALANLPHHRRLRIDFDVHGDPHGSLLLVVTAYDV